MSVRAVDRHDLIAQKGGVAHFKQAQGFSSLLTKEKKGGGGRGECEETEWGGRGGVFVPCPSHTHVPSLLSSPAPGDPRAWSAP